MKTISYLQHRRLFLLPLFSLFVLAGGFGFTPHVEAGNTSTQMIFKPPPSGIEATGVWFTWQTDKDVYQPGEQIQIHFMIGSDDSPQGSGATSIYFSADGGGDGTLSKTYPVFQFPMGVDDYFTITAPATPGPFSLRVFANLNHYYSQSDHWVSANSPGITPIPLSVAAPTCSLNCGAGVRYSLASNQALNDFNCLDGSRMVINSPATIVGGTCTPNGLTLGTFGPMPQPGVTCVQDAACVAPLSVSANAVGNITLPTTAFTETYSLSGGTQANTTCRLLDNAMTPL
ncbi:MAG: hypothetical protein WCT45_02965, partial [Candidatus Paceibacterota bacterium]